MQKIAVAIIGWGNVGRGCKRAIEECSDVFLAGVVRRPVSLLKNEPELANTRVAADITKLDKVDVALLCIPSSEIPERIKEYQELGICTVDAYDERFRLWSLKENSDVLAKSRKVVSIIGAGWDPGTDSAIRAIMGMVSITGRTTTTFGGEKGGRSMGHTSAVKAVAGVKDAVSLTLANGRGQHKRRVYVELAPDFSAEQVSAVIRKELFFADEVVELSFVKDINKYNTLHHEAEVERSGMQVNQRYTVAGVNPEFTANVMVSAARACIAAKEQGAFGAYTLLERPLADFLPGASLEEKLANY